MNKPLHEKNINKTKLEIESVRIVRRLLKRDVHMHYDVWNVRRQSNLWHQNYGGILIQRNTLLQSVEPT